LKDFYGFFALLRQFLASHPFLAWPLILLTGFLTANFISALYSRFSEDRKLFVLTPSECGNCTTVLKWRDIIPVVSFLRLKGKCRYCGAVLPRELLILETAGVLVPVIHYWVYGPTVACWIYTYFFLSLLLAALVDLHERVIPDEITLKGMACGMLASFLFPVLMGAKSPEAALTQSALGFLAGVFLMGTIRFAGDLMYREEIIGLGDVMLTGMAGAFLGLRLTLVVFFLAPLLALPAALNFWSRPRRAAIPYGPFIALASALALYWGDVILVKLQSLLVSAMG